MHRRFGSWILLAAFGLAALAVQTAGAAQTTIIDITNPSIRKIPIAIPLFKPLAENADASAQSESAADLTAETLEFTGYFKIMDRGAFLEDPRSLGISGTSLNFRNWTVIGAELMVTGGVSVAGDSLEMELRLFDTFQGQPVVGKRYRGALKDERRIIRRFCSEVIYYLTGQRGFFNSEVAFVSNGSGNKEIFIAEYDGRNPAQFTQTRNITLSPDWSSDGQWLAYTAYAKNNPNLYVKHRRQQRGVEIGFEGLNITPAWLPEASSASNLEEKQLAATLSFEGDQEIYLLTGKGKVIKRLTANWGSDVSPTWSPDGKKLAFVSNRTGSPQVHVLDVASGQTQRLTYEGRYNTQPSWSPRGDKIAYAGMTNSQNNIFVIGLDGRPPIQLTANAGNNESPSWSPDGSMIVFSSTREGASRIFVMTAFGTDQRRLLALPGEQTNPKWSPNVETD